MHDLAQQVAAVLQERQLKLVIAESCTCGALAASLGEISGISGCLGGSAVTYQLETKSAWLNVPSDLLQDPGPVSAEVARSMVIGVLQQTPHADLALSVTGDLGPVLQGKTDGLVYLAIAFREQLSDIPIFRLQLPDQYPHQTAADSLRLLRREDVVMQSLERLLQSLAP